MRIRLPVVLGIASLASDANAAGAVDAAAQESARLLGAAPASSVVVAAPLASDQAAPRGDELALRTAALVAGKIGSNARVHPQTAPLGAARAIAGRASALVYVQAEVSRGDFRTTVDVYPSMANGWDRIRNPLPAPIGHAFASAKIDAEVRSFLVPLVLEQASVHRARHDEADVLACACGDADGDGGNEILLVSRERVALGRLRGGKFVVERAASWSDLAPRTSVPMRDPLASAAMAEGTLAVGSTDRGALSLSPDLGGHAPLPGIPAWGGDGVVCLMPEPSAGAFDGAPFDCALSQDVRPKMAVPSPRYDAFAAAGIPDAHGISRAFVAVREPSGRLKLQLGDATLAGPEGTYGAQLAVGDLDQDGVPEVVASSDGPEDAVDVFSVSLDAPALRARLHLPAPAPVRAVAICPPEERGEPALIAVVGNEVWTVRAAAKEGP